MGWMEMWLEMLVEIFEQGFPDLLKMVSLMHINVHSGVCPCPSHVIFVLACSSSVGATVASTLSLQDQTYLLRLLRLRKNQQNHAQFHCIRCCTHLVTQDVQCILLSRTSSTFAIWKAQR